MSHSPFATVMMLAGDRSILSDKTKKNLERHNFTVHANTTNSISELGKIHPDVVILDSILNSSSDINICKKIRSEKATQSMPIIVLSSEDDLSNKITALENGADDYITKPFETGELIARINALLRRSGMKPYQESLVFGNIEMILDMKMVTIDGQIIKLSPIEYSILHLLLLNTSKVLSRRDIINKIWGYDADVNPRTVDVHVTKLRKAITLNGKVADRIKTIRSGGYALR